MAERNTNRELANLRDQLSRDPLREQIAAGIAAQIDAGLLRPGDILPAERDLAGLLEVSRESVRSALQILDARGLVEIAHGARCRVLGKNVGLLEASPGSLSRRFAGQSPATVMEARLALEPLLTGRAATRMDAAARGRVRRLVEAQADMMDDPVRFQISDRELHLLLHRAAGNPILARYAEEVYAHDFPLRREAMRFAGGVARAWRDHVVVLEALETRDASAAAAAMAAHIEHIHALAEGFRP